MAHDDMELAGDSGDDEGGEGGSSPGDLLGIFAGDLDEIDQRFFIHSHADFERQLLG